MQCLCASVNATATLKKKPLTKINQKEEVTQNDVRSQLEKNTTKVVP